MQMRRLFAPGSGAVVVWFLLLVQVALPVGAQPLAGDANCDGIVDAADLAPLVQALFAEDEAQRCGEWDANRDGRTSSADLTAVVHIFAPPAAGPVVSHLGLASPDGRPIAPNEIVAGRAVFHRPVGSGFQLVVEGRAGLNGQRAGSTVFAFDPRNPERRPDLQVLVNRPLGDGSPEVCSGGVPGIDPPDFSPGARVSNAINDFGCNVSLSGQASCTVDTHGRPTFVGSGSQIQFCTTISRALAFPAGETVVAVRLRDTTGVLGPIAAIVVRIGPPDSTATATPTPTRTFATLSPTRSPTPTLSPSATFTRTPPPLPTPSATPATVSTPVPPTFTPRSPSPSTAPGGTPSATPTERSASPTAQPSRTPTRTTTRTLTATVTFTRTPTRTWTATVPATPHTPTPTRTRTRTATATATATSSSALEAGPIITFFGLTRADDTRIEPAGYTSSGIPIFQRVAGAGFSLVIEVKPGSNGRPVGTVTFREDARPDLQIVSSRALGDGSSRVCDRFPPNAGGVPGIDPPEFSDAREIVDALNDFGCRFVDGTGQARARNRPDACILKQDGGFDFARSDSTVQFCGFVDVPMLFPPGDTLLTARVADTSGTLGPAAQIIIRVAP